MEEKLTAAVIETARLLNKTNVAWCVCAGAAASFYGVKRKITDLDVLIHPKDEQEVARILKQHDSKLGVREETRAYNHKDLGSLKTRTIKTSFGETSVEFIFSATVNNRWDFAGDRELFAKTRVFQVGGFRIPVSSPEDVIVLKGILQRGKSLGKFDVMDTIQIMRGNKLDLDYLRRRASKCRAGTRVMPLITRLIKRAKVKPKKSFKRKKPQRKLR